MSFSVHDFLVISEFGLGRVCCARTQEEKKQQKRKKERKNMAVHLKQFSYVCVQQEMPVKKEEEAWLLGKSLPLS